MGLKRKEETQSTSNGLLENLEAHAQVLMQVEAKAKREAEARAHAEAKARAETHAEAEARAEAEKAKTLTRMARSDIQQQARILARGAERITAEMLAKAQSIVYHKMSNCFESEVPQTTIALAITHAYGATKRLFDLPEAVQSERLKPASGLKA